ncbi:hypothetical protein CARUB_v10021216mg [Capsella rubella]|uniref:Uncharacterized protein n=1 Tax=Capsella rubella TaxID=81985 RepID=R0ICQ5_9BRAS|nr:hypothetical protein CARUB_v10021216mg [Capsella rubella]
MVDDDMTPSQFEQLKQMIQEMRNDWRTDMEKTVAPMHAAIGELKEASTSHQADLAATVAAQREERAQTKALVEELRAEQQKFQKEVVLE